VDEEVPEKSQLKPATIAMTTWFSSNRQPTWPVKRDMKHTACAFSARAMAYVVRATDFSYVGGKFEAQKSCEIQTICAIMKEIRVVTGMARNLQFFLFTRIPFFARMTNL